MSAETYISKVTRVGQITLPKEVREGLDISENDYIVIEKIGDTYYIKKFNSDKVTLEKIREKIKKTGISLQRVQDIIEEESKVVWEKRQGVS